METLCTPLPACSPLDSRTLRLLVLTLAFAWLSAGCTALSSGATPTPETDCLELIPDSELNTLYPYQDLWPIEDCREAYAAAWWMTGSGEHFRLTEVTQIMRVEAMPRAAAEEIVRHPGATVTGTEQRGAETAWLVILRGRFVLEPPLPYPLLDEDATTPQHSGLRLHVCHRGSGHPGYGIIGSIDCPSHPYLATPTL